MRTPSRCLRWRANEKRILSYSLRDWSSVRPVSALSLARGASMILSQKLVVEAHRVAVWGFQLPRIRTSMSHGRSVGRGFESRQVHQIAPTDGCASASQPGLFPRWEQYCGPELVSTAETMVGSSCREWTPRIKVYQTIKANSILAKVSSWVKGLFEPSFGLESAVSLA